VWYDKRKENRQKHQIFLEKKKSMIGTSGGRGEFGKGENLMRVLKPLVRKLSKDDVEKGLELVRATVRAYFHALH